MATSIRDRVRARLNAAKCERWWLVAHEMARGDNSAPALMLMEIVEALHDSGSATVRIYHEDWMRLYRFGRKKTGAASKVLRTCGVIYENHGAQLWRIDEEIFWPAFERALDLVCPPDLRDSHTPVPEEQSGGVRQAHPAPEEQSGGVPDAQSEDPAQGEGGPGGVPDAHQIRQIDIDDRLLAYLGGFRLRLRGKLEQWFDAMLKAARVIGMTVVREVVNRCIKLYGAEHWRYIAVSLTKEASAAQHGRQLALLPAVEVPKLKNDLHTAAPEAPAIAWDWSAAVEAEALKNDLQPAAETPERSAWETASAQLRLLDRRFEEYLRDAVFERTDGEALVVRVANPFVRDMLQTRLYRNVMAALAPGGAAAVRFEVAS